MCNIYFAKGAVLDEGDGVETLGVGDCLAFFPGAEKVPPAGFERGCTLNFNSTNIYPTASTCALVLTLPALYYDRYNPQ